MTRLIDANAMTDELIKGIEADTDKSIQSSLAKSVCMLICKAIEQQPTIDAEPVKRGKWIKADSQQYFRKHYPCFTCSECGYRKDSQKKWNYCPNCGADMRGESNE